MLSYDRAGAPQLVISHETALLLHDLSEINLAELTATVPPGFRKKLPPGVRLVHASLPESDWEQREGYQVTTPLRTLLDIAASARSWPFLEEAARQGLQRGLVRRSELEQTKGTTRMQARLRAALRRLHHQPPALQKVAQ